MEDPRYGKFKDSDNTEIYHMYNNLFRGSCDSMKHALTPIKLSQRGFDLGFDIDTYDPNDKVPINFETTDSIDGLTKGTERPPSSWFGFDAPKYNNNIPLSCSHLGEMIDESSLHTSSDTDCNFMSITCSDDRLDEDIL
ncbi:Hypothetical predicted protein [Olea europaea subsp. europaea]|uniref:Uncharacterized protein n=1 Tax=Olea europaea subsp. europaea TaxID=158383 RepID=A0A8S0SQ38_OLEEU|nr:Hypothetical predicted protein [Olea europaea subsp. europaea]